MWATKHQLSTHISIHKCSNNCIFGIFKKRKNCIFNFFRIFVLAFTAELIQ